MVEIKFLVQNKDCKNGIDHFVILLLCFSECLDKIFLVGLSLNWIELNWIELNWVELNLNSVVFNLDKLVLNCG